VTFRPQIVRRDGSLRGVERLHSLCAPAARRAIMMALLACLAFFPGCVNRRLTIISDPPGATVYIDDHEIGTTPCSTSYIYYGTHKVVLVKDGYEIRTVLHEIPTPWYEYFPADFVAENVVPWEIRDERTVEYKLAPLTETPVMQIQQRGEELRQGVQGQRLLNPPSNVFPAPGLPRQPPLTINLGAAPSATPR
jgi:hypothetical protein